jgi:hypothetical protein
MTDTGYARLTAALARRQPPEPADNAALLAELDALLATQRIS